jgi:hypothetical protein
MTERSEKEPDEARPTIADEVRELNTHPEDVAERQAVMAEMEELSPEWPE